MLTWSRPDNDTGAIHAAAGRRGIYTIRWNPKIGIVLNGVGHDGLTMLALSPDGRAFDTQTAAKDYAAQLDRTKTVEPEVSGT